MYKLSILLTLSCILGAAYCQNAPISTGTLTFLRNVQVNWTLTNERTFFYVTTQFVQPVLVTNAWLGIGFNNKPEMSGATVAICRIGNNGASSSINHYLTNGKVGVSFLDTNVPQLGLSNLRTAIVQNNFTCSFSRENRLNRTGYYQVLPNTVPYMLVAYGSGDVSYHGTNREARLANNFVYPLNQTSASTSTRSSNISTTMRTTTQIRQSTTTSLDYNDDETFEEVGQNLIIEYLIAFFRWFLSLFGIYLQMN